MFGIKKPLKVAAWSLIVLPFLAFAIFFLALIGVDIFSVGMHITFATILFLAFILNLLLVVNGFAELGKRFKSKLLVYASWTLFILFFIGVLYFISLSFETLILGSANVSWLLIIASFVGMIFFGIGLVKIGKNVELAKTTGIFTIIISIIYPISHTMYLWAWDVSAFDLSVYLGIIATMGFFIAQILGLVALILVIVMFFNASKKFEK
ncbi:MAG: hypothetical protein WDZ69_03235 [Candidatus Pacearchaeota archaeon]